MEEEEQLLLPMHALEKLMKGSSVGSGSIDENKSVHQTSKVSNKFVDTLADQCATFWGKYSSLYTAFAYNIIGECLDSLAILGMTAGLPSAKMNIQYKSLEERYGENVQQSYLFDPETLETYESALKTQMLMKFQKDRSYIEQVLQEANNEISELGCIQVFLRRLDEFKKSEQERDSLLEVTKENQLLVKNLSALLQKEKASLTKELDAKSEELGRIKDEYEDQIYENQMKLRYIDKWENARAFQNQVKLQLKETNYSQIIEEFKNKVMQENKVNCEIEVFLVETRDEYGNNIDEWMERYDQEMEMKEVEIQFLNEKRDMQLVRLHELSEMYESHKKEIEDCLVLRERRRVRELELARLTKAAVTIQAWWRGTMYRNHLGPYRKKKGKKGKDKVKKK